MAAEIQDHIHLSTSTPPSTEYKVYLEGYDPSERTPLVLERAVTGKLHAHRLFSSGSVKHLVEHTLRLKLTLAEKETIMSLAGRHVYYVPNYHDDADLSSYIVPCVLTTKPQGVRAVNAEGSHWIVVVTLVDDSL